MRIATYNVEWFANLFDTENKLLLDGGWSGRRDVTRVQQAEALGIVLTALDADAVMIIEAPDGHAKLSTERALENFARYFKLRTRKALVGFTNETQQEIALLYDPQVVTVRHDPLGDEKYPRFDQTFAMDLDVDAEPDPIRWSKPPLELALDGPAGPLRLIGVHAAGSDDFVVSEAGDCFELSMLSMDPCHKLDL